MKLNVLKRIVNYPNAFWADLFFMFSGTFVIRLKCAQGK